MLPKGPGNEDVNAIESEFFTFKGKSKTRQYLPNKVLDIYLGISYVKRTEIDNYIEEHSSNIYSVSVRYQVLLANSHETDSNFQKKMSLNFITDSDGPDLFLKDSVSISQVDEGVPGPSAKGNRLARKRQLSVTVSKLIIFCIIRVLTSYF
jgi:hypothetical protein